LLILLYQVAGPAAGDKDLLPSAAEGKLSHNHMTAEIDGMTDGAEIIEHPFIEVHIVAFFAC
jgi:hypothetical protein